jgi:lipopolysaccharide transport system permease protein
VPQALKLSSADNQLPKVRIDSSKILNFSVKEIWDYRELLYILIWRTLKIRYKQTVIGILWVIIQPIASMVLFSSVFGSIAKLPSNQIPYPIFTYCALLPWQLFSAGLNQSSTSLVQNKNLITKIYFPRLLIPLSSILSGLVDFFISLLVFFVLMVYYRIPLGVNLLTLPLFIFLAVISALAAGFWLSALNVKYRDIQFILPFLTQFLFFITPVAYSTNLVTGFTRIIYMLNPMVSVVEGFRWALVGQNVEFASSIWISILVLIVLFVSGVWYFKITEDQFADII